MICFACNPDHCLSEDIDNYGDCDVCPGTIHYGPEESRNLLGAQGLALASKLTKQKRVDLPFDAVPPASKAPSAPVTIRLRGDALVFYLKDIGDKSYIQLVTDWYRARKAKNLSQWSPEIYVQAAKADAVALSDSPATAWKKVKESTIYSWATMSGSLSWEEALTLRLLQGLHQLSQ
jgi:hypothetical protein